MKMSEKSKSAHLQVLIHRRDKVLAVLHPPTAAHARIMEKAGCEALFVGTGGVVGAYTRSCRCRHCYYDRMRDDRRLDC
jgi:2-methylisocitrate lyase-like PEP mutase family enzyme